MYRNWNGFIEDILLGKGTRQGGLTSPLLFNLFYEPLVDILSKVDGGVSIGKHKYNIFCCADDILLASTTVSDLQRLINTANHFSTNHGLHFNPVKTDCFIMGRHHFYKDPIFVLDGHDLKINHNVNYLGAVLDNVKGKSHASNRIGSCRKLFYALQGAGLCNTGLNVDTATYIWSNTCKNALLYACESIFFI